MSRLLREALWGPAHLWSAGYQEGRGRPQSQAWILWKLTRVAGSGSGCWPRAEQGLWAETSNVTSPYGGRAPRPKAMDETKNSPRVKEAVSLCNPAISITQCHFRGTLSAVPVTSPSGFKAWMTDSTRGRQAATHGTGMTVCRLPDGTISHNLSCCF